MKAFKRIHISLQTWLTLLVCAVVLVSLSVTGYLIGDKAAENERGHQAERVMDIASTISHTQLVIDGLTGAGPLEEIQSFTSAVQEDTNVEYIVVMDGEHIRQSHPNAENDWSLFCWRRPVQSFPGGTIHICGKWDAWQINEGICTN